MAASFIHSGAELSGDQKHECKLLFYVLNKSIKTQLTDPPQQRYADEILLLLCFQFVVVVVLNAALMVDYFQPTKHKKTLILSR